jgi:hypothetical protein
VFLHEIFLHYLYYLARFQLLQDIFMHACKIHWVCWKFGIIRDLKWLESQCVYHKLFKSHGNRTSEVGVIHAMATSLAKCSEKCAGCKFLSKELFYFFFDLNRQRYKSSLFVKKLAVTETFHSITYESKCKILILWLFTKYSVDLQLIKIGMRAVN